MNNIAKYTKNKLTLQPGGVTLIVQYRDGGKSRHPNIKYPDLYIDKILKFETREIDLIYTESEKKYIYTSAGK